MVLHPIQSLYVTVNAMFMARDTPIWVGINSPLGRGVKGKARFPLLWILSNIPPLPAITQ